MTSSATQLPSELVASLVLSAHARLPKSFLPAPTPAGPTWTPLAGIVLLPPPSSPTLNPLVVSLATGSKVLPEEKKSEKGDLIVDLHAEILAVRGFRRWLVDELERSLDGKGDGWLEQLERGWVLRESVKVWMYASDIPCGEASTGYLARQQLLNDPSMASLQASSSNSLEPPSAEGPTRGRSSYSVSNSLRTKPGRPDAPLALSLSCSDKIAQYRLVGIQGSLLSELVGVVRLEGVVMGPQASEEGEAWKGEVEAALEGRGRSELENGEIQALLPEEYTSSHPLQICPSNQSFPFSRQALPLKLAPSPSPFCTLSIASHPKPEKLAAGGFKLGSAKRKGSDVLHPSSRSAVCKLSMMGGWKVVWEKMGREVIRDLTYRQIKMGNLERSDDTGPPSKRPRLSTPPTSTSSPVDPSPLVDTEAFRGSRAYRTAKEVFRRKGRLFERWSRGDAKWESFDLSLLAGPVQRKGKRELEGEHVY